MPITPPNHSKLVAVIAVAIALLLGLCVGTMIGGAGGYLIGQRGAVERFSELATARPGTVPGRPFATVVPELRGDEMPFTVPMSGAWVRELLPDSPASLSGLRVGDVITHVDGVSVRVDRSLAEIIAAHQPGDRVVLTVRRGEQTRREQIELAESPDDPGVAYLGIRYRELSPVELPSTD